MHNPRRGEAALEIAGERYTLCLTLGGLAELEAAFGAQDLSDLGERFASGGLRSRDLIKLLAVGLRGGGHALTEAEVAALPIGSLETAMQAVADMLLAAFGEAPPNPPGPQEA